LLYKSPTELFLFRIEPQLAKLVFPPKLLCTRQRETPSNA
jgi:hypothetical protein